MKTTINILKVIIIIGIISVGNVSAQMMIGGTIGTMIPIGDGPFSHSANISGGIKGKYIFKGNFSCGIFADYVSFKEEKETWWYGNYLTKTNLFKSGLTAEYYFGKQKIKPYVGLDLGIYLTSEATKKLNSNNEVIENLGTWGDVFPGFAGGIGVLYNILLALCAHQFLYK